MQLFSLYVMLINVLLVLLKYIVKSNCKNNSQNTTLVVCWPISNSMLASRISKASSKHFPAY
jgi:hypothetical protein